MFIVSKIKGGIMKTKKIVQAAILSTILFLAVSCSTGRGYRNYPSAPQTGVDLILRPAPGIIVHYGQGGYYYRDPRGYLYWRGRDNRFYLDRRYMDNRYYRHPQYHEWQRQGGRSHRRR